MLKPLDPMPLQADFLCFPKMERKDSGNKVIWVFPFMGEPRNHPFVHRIFPYKPSILWGTPIYRNPHMDVWRVLVRLLEGTIATIKILRGSCGSFLLRGCRAEQEALQAAEIRRGHEASGCREG